MLKDRLDQLEGRIAHACRRCGRAREDVTLIAVTKVFPVTAILEAYELGLRHFGENYVQEFSGKYPQVQELPDTIFHLIGHLQSNKTKVASDMFSVIQTVDTPKLARRLNEPGKALEVMIEVKLSDEEAKHGTAPDSVSELVDSVRQCSHLRLTGLMTVPPWSEDAELSRPYFRKLREIAAAHNLPSLSMGMSNDFEVAIEEGATHIRVGTALFGSRKRV